MPSVITTHRPIPASIASSTAPLENAGGTNTTVTSAPVFAMASATVAKTGSSVPSKSTSWPALRGFTPPTTLVPALSIRLVCLVPSEPVMPWTMTLLCSFKKIAICPSRPYGGEFGGPIGRGVHGVHQLHARQGGVDEDAAARFGVVAVQPDHDRLVHRFTAIAQQVEGLHDAVGDRVARGDAAEDVDEHAAHGRVGQDDLQSVGHHLGRRAAADVQEVRRFDPGVPLTGVGDHVQGGHHQAGAVADDPDLALELHVVEVLRLGLGLQ